MQQQFRPPGQRLDQPPGFLQLQRRHRDLRRRQRRGSAGRGPDGGGTGPRTEAEAQVPAEPDRAGAVRGEPRRRPQPDSAAPHRRAAVRSARIHGHRRGVQSRHIR